MVATLARAVLNIELKRSLTTLEEITLLLAQLNDLPPAAVRPSVPPILLVAIPPLRTDISLAIEFAPIGMCRVRFPSPLSSLGTIRLTVPVVFAARGTTPLVVVCEVCKLPLCGLLISDRALAQVRTAATALILTLKSLRKVPVTGVR